MRKDIPPIFFKKDTMGVAIDDVYELHGIIILATLEDLIPHYALLVDVVFTLDCENNGGYHLRQLDTDNPIILIP